MKRFVIGIISAVLFQYNAIYGNTTETELNKAYAIAVTGDIRLILSVLDSLGDLNQNEFTKFHENYTRRFITADEHIEFNDPLMNSMYSLYTTYWRSSLIDPNREKEARKQLISGLDRLSKMEGRKVGVFEIITGPDINNIEKFFINKAKENGYYLLMGRTIPLRELMIWKQEDQETYKVALPSDSFSVNVVFVQDFLLKGWLGYATFDKKHTGGWYKGDTIYHVGAKPDENNEWFRVSLLGHEGRHISDKKHYRNLKGWILEYRAKLTELMLADESFWELLNGFKAEAQDNISVPHAYASYRIINDLMDELAQGQETMAFNNYRFENYSKERLKKAIEYIFLILLKEYRYE